MEDRPAGAPQASAATALARRTQHALRGSVAEDGDVAGGSGGREEGAGGVALAASGAAVAAVLFARRGRRAVLRDDVAVRPQRLHEPTHTSLPTAAGSSP